MVSLAWTVKMVYKEHPVLKDLKEKSVKVAKMVGMGYMD